MIVISRNTQSLALKAIRRLSSSLSSLEGTPTSRLVTPGQCQFGEEFQSVPLLNRTPVSKSSSVLRFSLPDASKPLNLSTCACILAKADLNDESVIRPYTPISTNSLEGSFDLLVKSYGKHGLLSRHLHEMTIGDSLEFKHIPFNVKIQAPFPQKHILMLAGGTGITPMIQALHAILGEDSQTKVSLLYGSQSTEEILAKKLLEQWASDYSDRFELVHVVSSKAEVADSSYHQGYIDMALIQQYAPTIKDDTLVLVCGPPPMYESLCGPRDVTELKGILKELGCSADNVYKF